MGNRAPQVPKHVKIREVIRARILKGAYPPGSKLPTEIELPKQLRVSTNTVVRALNALVREGLIVRRRRSGSFVADPAHKPLIPGRQLRLGIMVDHSILPDFRHTSPFVRAVIDGLLEGWGAEGVASVPVVSETEATVATWKAPFKGVTVQAIGEETIGRPKHPPIETIQAGRFDGLVALGISDEAFITRLVELKLPLVLADFPNEQFSLKADQVYFDPLPGYRKAMEYLKARGARRFHFVGELLRRPSNSYEVFRSNPDRFNPEMAMHNPDSILRLNACRQVLTEMGLPFNERCIHYTWTDKVHIRPEAEKLASLPAGDVPDAVVCHSAELAHEIIEVFASKRIWLAGTGATSMGYLGSALPIFADGRTLGRTAASLTTWKLQFPERPALRVGVPMHFLSKEPVDARPVLV